VERGREEEIQGRRERERPLISSRREEERGVCKDAGLPESPHFPRRGPSVTASTPRSLSILDLAINACMCV
jgi:hypothetical protein